MNKHCFKFASLALTTVLLPLAAHAATRTHVSNNGNDANTASSCDYAHPCRTFAAALTVTTAGGEILAIDSSGYGKVTIDRSVSIIAAPGVFAGVGVGAGGNATGIEIATAGVNVVLRGLSITGQGGNYGVNMTNGARLSVENCVISNFSTGTGVRVDTAANVRVIDSLFRDNQSGARFYGGAAASISGTRFYGHVFAVRVDATTATTTTVVVERSVASGGGDGFGASSSHAGGISRLHVTDSVVSNNSFGIYAYATTGVAEASVSDSLVTGNASEGLRAFGSGAKLIAGNNTVTKNAVGLAQASAAVLESDGTNTVRNNTTDTSGTITAFSRM